MKEAKPAWLVAVVALAACSSAGTGRSTPTSWTPGRYEVRGQVSYRDDSMAGETMQIIDVHGEVDVGFIGPLSMTSSLGVCRDPPRIELERQLREGSGRSFECGDGATFYFRAASAVFSGGVSVPVLETIRRRGRCLAYVDDPPGVRACVDYDYTFRSNRTRKGATLQSTPLR